MITTLSQLIAQAESSQNPYAVRFEPLHRPAQVWVDRLALSAHISVDTAQTLCACSWGMYQEMGDNLVAAGLTLSPVEFASKPDLQTLFFRRFLQNNGIDFDLDAVLNDSATRLEFATRYNGPGAPEAYGDYLLRTYAAYKGA